MKGNICRMGERRRKMRGSVKSKGGECGGDDGGGGGGASSCKRHRVQKGEGVERIGRDVVDRLRRTRMMMRSSDRIGPCC